MSNGTKKYFNYSEKIKDKKKETNIIHIPQQNHSNNYRRSNHQYHEIKSISSEKIENESTNKRIRYHRGNNPQISNTTSMENIRYIRRNQH